MPVLMQFHRVLWPNAFPKALNKNGETGNFTHLQEQAIPTAPFDKLFFHSVIRSFACDRAKVTGSILRGKKYVLSLSSCGSERVSRKIQMSSQTQMLLRARKSQTGSLLLSAQRGQRPQTQMMPVMGMGPSLKSQVILETRIFKYKYPTLKHSSMFQPLRRPENICV